MSSAVLVKATLSSLSAIVANMSGTWGAQTSAMKMHTLEIQIWIFILVLESTR